MPEPAQHPSVSVQPGDVLDGKFRVERVLGEGGMGVVVAATHLTLGQVVALKFMLPQALTQKDNVARFEREARAVVRLRSEHVARVSDVGRLQNGAPYIVMEFLEGIDLDRLIESKGALPVDIAIDYMLQACEAIAEAHLLGIVHRDLKPTNLFLTSRVSGKPLVKVLDFGISKSNGMEDLSLTSTTQTMGSPNYMSPEQMRSAKDVDARTDIWALGAILYELLTCQVPFPADTVTQLSVMVVTEEPRPITELRPDLPPGLVAAIMKCLEKKRENRFQSVSELAAAIAPFGSPDAVMKAAEIASTSGEHPAYRGSIPDIHPPSSLSGSGSAARSAPGARTASAWDRTQLAPESVKNRRRSIVLTSTLAIAALSVAAFVVHRHVATPTQVDTTVQSNIVATVTVPPTAATSAAAATGSPSQIETASTVATASHSSTPQHPKTAHTSTHTNPPPSATIAQTPTATTSTSLPMTHPAPHDSSTPLTLPNVRN